MARQTTHYEMTVPELSDAADVTVVAAAIDAVDSVVYTETTGARSYVDSAIGTLEPGETVASAVASAKAYSQQQAAASNLYVDGKLGDLGNQTAAAAVAGARQYVDDKIEDFEDSVPVLVTAAIGSDVRQAVADYLEDEGLSVGVDQVAGATAGVSVGGTTYSPDASTQIIALPVVKTVTVGSTTHTPASATGDLALTIADFGGVPTTRTVNSKPLSDNVNLTAADVNALGSVDVYMVTVAASDWSSYSGVYRASKTVTGLKATDSPTISLSVTTNSASAVTQARTAYSLVYRAVTAANSLTLYAVSVPDDDFTILVKAVH